MRLVGNGASCRGEDGIGRGLGIMIVALTVGLFIVLVLPYVFG